MIVYCLLIYLGIGLIWGIFSWLAETWVSEQDKNITIWDRALDVFVCVVCNMILWPLSMALALSDHGFGKN